MEKRGRKIFALTTLFASEYHHHAHFAQEGDATLLQSRRSPHFKFSFLHCALQFESDMPPYSRAVQRYTSTLLQYKVVQGGQREDGRLRNLVNRCHETLPTYQSKHSMRGCCSSFTSCISLAVRRPVEVECAKRERDAMNMQCARSLAN